MGTEKKIVIVSDDTGQTARRLLDTVLVQNYKDDLEFSVVNTYPQVRHKKELDQILKDIDSSCLVLFSIVSTDLGEYFEAKLSREKVPHLNVLKPMVDTMSKFLGVQADYQPDRLQIPDDRYYRKVDSIGYTVSHDDGCGQAIEEADAVLLGPSGTCKTPLSMYLACNHGLKVANIPMVRDKTMTQNLFERLERVSSRKIIGLLMQPEVLSRVRGKRMNVLLRKDSHQVHLHEYHDLGEVALEFRYCRDVFTSRGFSIVDVTRRAIEDLAGEILKKLQ